MKELKELIAETEKRMDKAKGTGSRWKDPQKYRYYMGYYEALKYVQGTLLDSLPAQEQIDKAVELVEVELGKRIAFLKTEDETVEMAYELEEIQKQIVQLLQQPTGKPCETCGGSGKEPSVCPYHSVPFSKCGCTHRPTHPSAKAPCPDCKPEPSEGQFDAKALANDLGHYKDACKELVKSKQQQAEKIARLEKSENEIARCLGVAVGILNKNNLFKKFEQALKGKGVEDG